MAKNLSIYKSDLNQINRNTIKEAIYLAFECGVTSRAILGYSGDDIRLFGTMIDGDRESIVEIRHHSGSINLLITDIDGHFLVYNSYSPNLGLNVVVNKIWTEFNSVKDKIGRKIKTVKFDNINQKRKIKPLNGFKKLCKYQSLNSVSC